MQIEFDDDEVTEAMRLMGVGTKDDAVNIALREYVASAKRLQAAEKRMRFPAAEEIEGG